MPPTARAKHSPASRHFPWFPAEAAAFFAASWLYVLLRLEPAISLHGASPAFFFGAAFRAPFMRIPGGWLEYVGAFLSRCDALPLLGSAIQAGVALLLVVLTRETWHALAEQRPGNAAFVPGFLAVLLRELWGYSAYSACLAVALALGSFLVFTFARTLPAWSRIVLVWTIAVLLFLFAGPVATVLFALLAALYAGGTLKKLPAGLGCLVAVLIPFAWHFVGSEPDSWKAWIPEGALARTLMAALIGWAPVMALILMGFSQDKSSTAPGTPADTRKTKPATPGWQQRLEPITRLMVFAAGWLVLWQLFDGQRQARMQIDYYSSRGDHQRVIALAQTLKPGEMDGPATLRLHRALFHTGRLCSEFFRFPVADGLELFPSLNGDLRNCRPQAETLYELGLNNDAEHFAHEALEWEGERPETLRLLAKINCLKDRPAAARVFLNRLAKIPFEAQWPGDWLRSLDAKGTLPDAAGLAEIRNRLLTKDYAHDILLTEPLLLSLLACNNSNRMAYDFLMTHYLLNLDLKKLVAQMTRLEDFGCREIPEHLEEALLIHHAVTGEEVKSTRLKIRDSTRKRFEAFSHKLDQELQSKRNPLSALNTEFQNTYWYYFTSRQSQGVAPSN